MYNSGIVANYLIVAIFMLRQFVQFDQNDIKMRRGKGKGKRKKIEVLILEDKKK